MVCRTLSVLLGGSALLLSASPAWAQEPTTQDLGDPFAVPELPSFTVDAPRDQARQVSASRAGTLTLALQSGAAMGDNSSYWVSGMSLGAWVLPELSLGGYLQASPTASVLDQGVCDRSGACASRFARAGVRAELHWLRDFFVDPWLGGELGALSVWRQSGGTDWTVDGALQAGVDFRPSRALSLGPYVAVAPALRERSDYQGHAAVFLRVGWTFGAGASGAVARADGYGRRL